MEEAFRGLLMTQQYPQCALLVELPGELVDVNVHPTKEEVRFHNESLIRGSVHRAVKEALLEAEIVPTLSIPAPDGNIQGVQPGMGHPKYQARDHPEDISPEMQPVDSQPDFRRRFGFQTKIPQPESATKTPLSSGGSEQAKTAELDESTLIQRLRELPNKPEAVAQVALTYVIANASHEGMIVIDQHAAHEKIMYMKMMNQFNAKNSAVELQTQLVPHQIEVAPEEKAVMENLIPPLGRTGFEIEPFGNRTFIVQSIPMIFENLDVESFMRDLLDDIGQGDLEGELERTRKKICARASCHSAVKSGDYLAPQEQQKLVDELLTTSELLRCPHGRPTTLILTREHLDRQFGRLG